MNVLIVEDEFFVGLDFAYMVESLGHRVLGPSISSSDALLTAQSTHPDIALVDVHLADGPTGPLLAAELAAKYGTAIIMATANTEGLRKGENGVVTILRKPFRPEQVTAALSIAASCH